MLKVNVGLSRKLSRDYNSTGFSLNLEGELCVGPDDPEAMIEKIKEFYDLAEEALNQQLERYEGESAIASRDEGRQEITTHVNDRSSGSQSPRNGRHNNGGHQPTQGQNGNGDAATNKQIQFLLNLGKRQGLTPHQLEGRIENTFGRRIGVYQLSKQEAGQLIDALNQSNGSDNGRGNGA